jgi:hypothetical protein
MNEIAIIAAESCWLRYAIKPPSRRTVLRNRADSAIVIKPPQPPCGSLVVSKEFSSYDRERGRGGGMDDGYLPIAKFDTVKKSFVVEGACVSYMRQSVTEQWIDRSFSSIRRSVHSDNAFFIHRNGHLASKSRHPLCRV